MRRDSLQAVAPLAVLVFDLRDVFDIDFKIKAPVEAGGVPGKTSFPAVQAAVDV